MKIHVLVIPSFYPRFNGDYVGSFWREQAIGVSKQNCKVGVIYPELESLRSRRKIRLIPKFDFKDDEGVLTYRYLWTNWFIKLRHLQITSYKILGMILFKKYIKEHGLPDIIHCQSIFNAGFLGEYIYNIYKIDYIINEVNSGFLFKNQGLQKYYKDAVRITNKSKECYTVSNKYAKYLNEELPNKLKWKVHHNIVSNKFLNAKLVPRKNKKFVFLSIARLHKVKNLGLIIKSFKIFNNEVENSELRFIGVGSEYDHLKKLSINLNIESQVKFLGRIDRKNLINEINDSNALVHSCPYETFGVVFVEALALGRPIVAVRSPGSSDILTKEVGILSENNEISMSNSMIEIFKRYNEFDPFYIRKYCRNNFSEDFLSKKMLDNYNSILSN
jgi:L-malate glycosyltransferase